MKRDLLAIMFSVVEDAAALSALEILKGSRDYAAAMLVDVLPAPVVVGEGGACMAVPPEILAEARRDFEHAKGELAAACRPSGIDTCEATCIENLSSPEIALRTRLADLTIMLRPHGAVQEHDRESVLEEVLFGSGRPVMLVPPEGRKGAIGRDIVIAWNGRREAARALADAMMFVDGADRVTVVTVDAVQAHGDGDLLPGSDVVAHLARKGVVAGLRNIRSTGGRQGEALIDDATAHGADLIVMGGYGTARLREMVFGGVTRTLSRAAPVPILLSH